MHHCCASHYTYQQEPLAITMDIAGSSQFELEDGQIAETTHNNPRNAPPGQNVPNIPSVPNVSNTPIKHITQNNDTPNIKHIQVSDLSAVASTINPLDSLDRKSTRLNSSHTVISYAVFCLKKKI